MKEFKYLTMTSDVKFEILGEVGNRTVRISNRDVNGEIISQAEIPFMAMHMFVREYLDRVLVRNSFIEL